MNKLTVAMVKKALKKDLDFVDNCIKSEQKDNPQVIEMKLQAVGRVDVLQAVLDAMHGDASTMSMI